MYMILLRFQNKRQKQICAQIEVGCSVELLQLMADEGLRSDVRGGRNDYIVGQKHVDRGTDSPVVRYSRSLCYQNNAERPSKEKN